MCCNDRRGVKHECVACVFVPWCDCLECLESRRFTQYTLLEMVSRASRAPHPGPRETGEIVGKISTPEESRARLFSAAPLSSAQASFSQQRVIHSPKHTHASLVASSRDGEMRPHGYSLTLPYGVSEEGNEFLGCNKQCSHT